MTNLDLIKFEMFDDGNIREYKYKGVLLFRTSKHRGFTRRIREEFIEKVATMQERVAESEPLMEAVNDIEKENLDVHRYSQNKRWFVSRSVTTEAEKGRGEVLEEATADWKHKYPPKPEPKPTADELLMRVNISNHDGITEDDYDNLKRDIDDYCADQDREADDE